MANRPYDLWSNGLLRIQPSWPSFDSRISKITGTAKNVKSYQKNLKLIARQAEQWGLDPTPLQLAIIDNLTRMIRPAKVLIEYDDPNALQELFWDAARMSVCEFRIRCGISRAYIKANKHELNGDIMYFMMIPEEQLDRLEKTTRLQFWFDRKDSHIERK